MILFDKEHIVSKEEVQERVKYFKIASELGFKLYEKNPAAAVHFGRILRAELKEEYHFYHLERNRDLNSQEYFSEYKAAVTDAYVKTSGNLSRSNVNSFLYDLGSYMNYWQAHSKYKE